MTEIEKHPGIVIGLELYWSMFRRHGRRVDLYHYLSGLIDASRYIDSGAREELMFLAAVIERE